MMLDSKTDDFVHPESNVIALHVRFRFSDIVRRSGYTAASGVKDRGDVRTLAPT